MSVDYCSNDAFLCMVLHASTLLGLVVPYPLRWVRLLGTKKNRATSLNELENVGCS